MSFRVEGGPPYLSLGVAEDDSLSDCECVVEITESVKLPLFLLHCHKELLDALQSQLITAERERERERERVGVCVWGIKGSSPFHEDPDWLSHELVCHLQNIVRQCRTHQHHLPSISHTKRWRRERERERERENVRWYVLQL